MCKKKIEEFFKKFMDEKKVEMNRLLEKNFKKLISRKDLNIYII